MGGARVVIDAVIGIENCDLDSEILRKQYSKQKARRTCAYDDNLVESV